MTARLEQHRWWRSQLPHLPSCWNVTVFNFCYVMLVPIIVFSQSPMLYVCCNVATYAAPSVPVSGYLFCLITTGTLATCVAATEHITSTSGCLMCVS